MSDPSFPAVLGTRQRWIAGLGGIGLGFVVPFILSVILVATSGDMALLVLPLPCLFALWAIQGLAPAGFTLESAGVRIERRWLSRLIPYVAIQAVDRERRAVGGLGAVGLNGLFGSQGPRWNPRTGWHYLAIANTTDLVYLHTRVGLMVLSPSRPEEFCAELRRRIPSADPA